MSEDSRRMSRRKMLAALGIAGAAAVGLGVSQARGSTVTDFVYGGEEDCPDHRCGVTPYDFGAAGDGIADDTAACRQWISYAYQHSVSALIPKGTFLVDELYPLAGVKFIGLEYPKTGTYQTCVLSNYTPGKSVFKGDSVSRVCFQDVTINGLGKGGKGFDFGLLKDSVFTRLMVTGFSGGTAFRVGGGWSNFLYECYFNECGDGFVYDNGVQELNQTIWTNCQFNANDRYGAALLNSQNNGTNIGSANVFLNCDAENNGDTGIYLHTGKNTKIIGGYIEYNRKFGIRQVPGTGGVQMQGLVVSPAFVIGTKNKPGLPQDSVGVSIEYALNPVVAGQIVNCKEGLKIGYYADGCDYSGTFLGSSDTNLVDQSRSHNYDSKLLSTRGGVLKIKTGATNAADYVPASAVTDRILSNLSAPKSFDVIVKSGVGGTVPQFVEFLLCGCDDGGSNASYLEKVAVYRGSSSFWETKTTFSSDAAGNLWSIALSNKTDQSVRVTVTANHPGSHAGDTANLSTVSPDIYACKPVY